VAPACELLRSSAGGRSEGVSRLLPRETGRLRVAPFAPLPARIRRGRSRNFHSRLVEAIQAEEAALLIFTR
jgi:hypothetical protein